MVIVTKIMVFLLMLSILNVIKEGINFAMSYAAGKTLDMTPIRKWGVGISLSYILTIIFTGFNLF